MSVRARLVVLVACCMSLSIPVSSARLGQVLYADAQPDCTILGDLAGDSLGLSQAIGDLDGDGIDDLLLATWDFTPPGHIEILLGPILTGSRDLRSQPADIRIVGPSMQSRFGGDGTILLADMDGDGNLDVILGTPLEAAPSPRDGMVRVLFGPFSRGTHAIDDLPSLRVQGWPGSALGWAPAIGDVSGDGVPDLAIGEEDGGHVQVLFGPLTEGIRSLSVTPADITLTGGTTLGNSSFAIGDVSGDGQPDLIVGEPHDNGRLGDRVETGAIHILRGPLRRGMRDLRVEPADVTIHGDRGRDYLGEVVRVGDLDLDGNADIVASGWGSDRAPGQQFAGTVTVVFGPFILSHLDLRGAVNQARILGAEAEDFFGWDVLLADVSGDSLPDLVVGAIAGGDLDAGVAHVFHAPITPGTTVDLATDVSDLAITGAEPDAACCLSRDAADLDGDGTMELVFSCYYADRPDGSAADAGIVYLLSPEPAGAPASPSCDAGAPVTVACDAPRRACGVDVQLDGSASRDARGGVLAFEWEVACGGVIALALGPTPIVCLDAAPGTTCTATLTVTSPEGLATSCATRVELAADAGPPELSGVPPDEMASCDALPPAPGVTATDDCGAAVVSLDERLEPGACDDSYRLIRTWTATDAAGKAVEAQQEIVVSDLASPVLLGVPPAITVGCGAVPAPAPVEARDGCDPSPSLTMVETVVPGNCAQSILRTWTARDRCGNEASARQAIDVRDEEAPVVVASDADLAVLWAPNHHVTCVDASALAPSISEACSLPVTWRLVDCVSDQPDDGRGDGATQHDCVVAPDGQSACVRSERAGGLPSGRRYALSVVATDACGNASAPTLIGFVRVPHDKRRRR